MYAFRNVCVHACMYVGGIALLHSVLLDSQKGRAYSMCIEGPWEEKVKTGLDLGPTGPN